MNKEFFYPKQQIELHIEADGDVLNLPTYVQSIPSRSEFVVAAPYFEGQLYPLLANEKLEMYAVIEGQGIISCAVMIQKKMVNNETVYLLLSRLTDVRRIQRRRHFRLPTLLDAELEIQDRENRVRIHGVTRDISAGGIRVVTSSPLYKKEHVKLKLSLNGEKIELDSSVVDSIETNELYKRYETRIKFETINIDNEKAIIAYIFDEQLKRRTRGV